MIRPAIQNQTNNTPQRTGNDFVANIAPWGDSDGPSGFVPMGANQVTTTLWRGDTKVGSIKQSQLYARDFPGTPPSTVSSSTRPATPGPTR